jgi:flagellar protein FlgJ
MTSALTTPLPSPALAMAANARSSALAGAQAALAPTRTGAQAQAAAMTPDQRDAAKAKIGVTAKSFEAAFLASMMGSMFEGVDMGGGQGAAAFKSVMMEAVGKKIEASGGIGLAKSVQAEMLKMQGLN